MSLGDLVLEVLDLLLERVDGSGRCAKCTLTMEVLRLVQAL